MLNISLSFSFWSLKIWIMFRKIKVNYKQFTLIYNLQESYKNNNQTHQNLINEIEIRQNKQTMDSYYSSKQNFNQGDYQNYRANSFQRQYQDENYNAQYYVAQEPTRQQIAKHFQSSLDQPNLNNVQAKLRATRQRNFQMGKSYYRNKYGTADKFQQEFGGMYREAGIQHRGGFQQMLLEQADRIRRQEMEKIRRKALGVPQRIRIQQDQASTGKQQRKSSKNRNPTKNPWLQQQKPNKPGTLNQGVVNRKKQLTVGMKKQGQTLNNLQGSQSQHRKQSNSDQEQFVDYADNNQHSQFRQQRKRSDFLNGFKQYLLKKQNNQSNYQANDEVLDQSIEISKSKVIKQKSKPKNNLKQKRSESPLTKIKSPVSKIQISHEQQLVKKIYKDVLGTSNLSHKSSVSKLQLVQYLIANKRIIKVLGMNEQSLTEQILRQQTKDPNQISYKEFLFYIFKILGKEKERKVLESNWRDTTIPEGCMLNQETVSIFQAIFKKLDKYQDLIVPRVQLVSKLATDPSIRKLLNSPAVFQKELERSISLRRIFERIQLECLLGNQEQQKSKQYISWQQLMNYFTSGHNEKSKYDLIILLQSLKNQQKIGLSEIPQNVITIFNNVFERLQNSSPQSRAKQYFNTLEVIDMIRNDRQFESAKYQMVRPNRNEQTGLGMESLQQVLTRIQQTGYKYMSAKQFLEHFSQRGRPIDLLQIQESMLLQKSFGGTKVRFSQDARKMEQQSRKNVEKYNENLENEGGYDSDPQLYSSNVFNGAKRDIKLSPKKSGKSKSKQNTNQISRGGQTLNSAMIQSQGNRGGSPIKVQMKNQYKITVPEPFKFQERQKQRHQRKQTKKLNRSASVTSGPELNKHFHARQIPKKVLQVGLFEKMMQEDQRRQQQRKRTSMLMTLANQQPFSFDTNHRPKQKEKVHKKNRFERQQFVFKAKPIPWYCSVNILAKNKETEAERNQKIAKKAQENLAKAKLPPRMQKDFQQKLAKRILEEQRKRDNKGQSQNVFKSKQPPNFDKLHKEFEQQLQRKRKQNKTTQIKAFNFSQIKPKQPKISQNDQNAEAILNMTGGFQRKTFTSIPKQNEPPIAANSTAKFNQQCDKRRRQIEQKRKAEQQKRKQDLKRLQVDEDLKKKVQQKASRQKVKQKQALEKRRQTMKAEQKAYQERKQQIIQKGRSQPMLMDRPLKRDQKIDKMKKLHMISQTLKNNGIKGKQHDTYFKKEQLLLLQDYALLKDKL